MHNPAPHPADADSARSRTLTTTTCLIGEVCGDPSRGMPVIVTHWADRFGAIIVDAVQVGHAFADFRCFSDWQLANFVDQIRQQQARAVAGARCQQQLAAEAAFSDASEVPA